MQQDFIVRQVFPYIEDKTWNNFCYFHNLSTTMNHTHKLISNKMRIYCEFCHEQRPVIMYFQDDYVFDDASLLCWACKGWLHGEIPEEEDNFPVSYYGPSQASLPFCNDYLRDMALPVLRHWVHHYKVNVPVDIAQIILHMVYKIRPAFAHKFKQEIRDIVKFCPSNKINPNNLLRIQRYRMVNNGYNPYTWEDTRRRYIEQRRKARRELSDIRLMTDYGFL